MITLPVSEVSESELHSNCQVFTQTSNLQTMVQRGKKNTFKKTQIGINQELLTVCAVCVKIIKRLEVCKIV